MSSAAVLLLARRGAAPVPPVTAAQFVIRGVGAPNPPFAPYGPNVGAQQIGVAFNVRITALNASGEVETGFTGSVTISASLEGVTVSAGGTTANFTAGVLPSHALTLSGDIPPWIMRLLCTSGTTIGASNFFSIAPAEAPDPPALTSLAVEAELGGAIGTCEVGVETTIRLRTKDQYGANYPYTGTAIVSSTGSLSAGEGETAAFVNGECFHDVTFDAAGAGITITAYATDDSAVLGTSNAFTVDPAAGAAFGVEPGFTLVNINSTGNDHQYVSGEAGWSVNGSISYYTDDGTDPYSPGNGAIATYPASFGGGSGPFNRFRESNWINSGTRRVIIDLAFKVSANFQGHDSAINKLLHIWLPRTETGSSHNGGVLMVHGTDAGTLRMRYATQNGISAHFATNLTDVPIVRDTWYWVRVMLTMNTGTSANGHVDLWVAPNGADLTKIMHHENVMHTGWGTKEFRWFTTNATWGGVGDSVVEEMTIRFSRAQVLVEDA